MSRESGRPKGRRFALLGLVLLLIPSSAKSGDQSTCTAGQNPLVCAPVEVLRVLAPIARFLLADLPSAEVPADEPRT